MVDPFRSAERLTDRRPSRSPKERFNPADRMHPPDHRHTRGASHNVREGGLPFRSARNGAPAQRVVLPRLPRRETRTRGAASRHGDPRVGLGTEPRVSAARGVEGVGSGGVPRRELRGSLFCADGETRVGRGARGLTARCAVAPNLWRLV